MLTRQRNKILGSNHEMKRVLRLPHCSHNCHHLFMQNSTLIRHLGCQRNPPHTYSHTSITLKVIHHKSSKHRKINWTKETSQLKDNNPKGHNFHNLYTWEWYTQCSSKSSAQELPNLRENTFSTKYWANHNEST